MLAMGARVARGATKVRTGAKEGKNNMRAINPRVA
jgi:hypothetical protein